ncbi:Rnf-Nqr domain containing protein [Stutzerimonas kirkiae]|uniref:Rnf-Nqr domain containing protein n=1 Tax=Stutzerimonas kirkiae TaxID=2211392 RepID=UPI001F612FDD|nr:Rnf-Nqr domain containing protein [Stutzerimonas kirkiae]
MNEGLRRRARESLWQDNPVLRRLLGLCPLLAVSDSLVKALGLGLAVLLVLPLAGLGAALVGRVPGIRVRLPALLLINATLATCAELLLQAFAYELQQRLGIFIALLASSSLLLATRHRAGPHAPLTAATDAALTGLGFVLLLLPLAALRESLGSGRLLADAHLLFGPRAQGWGLALGDYQGFALPLLAPGGFILLGLLIALYNRLEQRRRERLPGQSHSLHAGTESPASPTDLP